MAWKLITNIKGNKGDKGDVGNTFNGHITTSINLNNWFGLDYIGSWGVPTQAAADGISSRPSGAGPGIVSIMPVGATASIQIWVEYSESGRVWTSSVSNGSRLSPWKDHTSSAHAGNIANVSITHFDQIDYDSEYSVWNANIATDMGAPVAAVGKIKTETIGNFALQTFRTASAYFAGPEIHTRARTSTVWGEWFKVHPSTGNSSAQGVTADSGFKNALFQLTQQSAAATENVSNANVRFPVQAHVGSTRARLHVRNWHYFSGTVRTGAVSFTGAWFGRSNGANFLTTPTRLLGAFSTPANGDEYISPWFNFTLAENEMHLLSLGFTNASGQVNAQSRAGCYRTSSSLDAALVSGFTASVSSVAPFDVWLELEVPAETNIVAGFGDSNTVGTGTTFPVYDSWLAQYCRQAGALPYFMAVHGSTSDSWEDRTSPVWNRYEGQAKPDSVVYFLGQNDLQEGVTLSELKSKVESVMTIVRDRLSENVYVATVTPANSKSPEVNMVRRSLNSWLKTRPLGVKDCFDFSAAVSDDDTTIRDADNADGLHFKTSGHAKISSRITPSIVPVVLTQKEKVALKALL